MRRLLAIATAMVLVAGCGGPVVTGPTDTAQAPLNPQTPGEMIPVPVGPMDIIDMPVMDVDLPVVRHDIEQLMAPPREERFFYVVPVSMKELPALPTPPCPACVR